MKFKVRATVWEPVVVVVWADNEEMARAFAINKIGSGDYEPSDGGVVEIEEIIALTAIKGQNRGDSSD